jgi:colanic acid/amylovoran biosynthesis glycosyltransferase
MKPRLAYLVNKYPALSHTFIFREVDGLRRLGFDIRVASINACDRSPEDMPADEAAELNTVYYVKRGGVRGALKSHVPVFLRSPLRYLQGLAAALRLAGLDPRALALHFFYFVEAVMIGHWMKRSGIGHLHAHFGGSVSTVGLIAARVFPIALSITIHGPDEFYDVRHFHLTEKVRGARFIACVSDFARSQLMLLSGPSDWRKLEVVRLGVDPAEFALAEFRETPGPFRIVCVARCTAAKGLDVLIASVGQLLAKGRDVRLCIVGDGPERARLAPGSTGRIEFAGAVKRTGIGEYLSQADVFALASFAEGIPVALMEAMAMGVPCVSTRITGIPELIEDGVDGLLASPGSVDEFAGALERLMDDVELRRSLRQAARRKIERSYNLAQNLGLLARTFERYAEAR